MLLIKCKPHNSMNELDHGPVRVDQQHHRIELNTLVSRGF